MNHLGVIFMETERLILRPFKESDVADVYNNWTSDDKVTQYLTWPTHKSMEVTKMLVDLWISESEKLQNYQWCIVYKENQQAIGNISVVDLDENIEAVEIGYCIGAAYWQKGITTEAFKAVIRFLFEEVGCNRISARHDISNPSSGAVMKKSGLEYEGTLLQAGKNNTGICDVAIYGITKQMYFSR